MSSVVPFEVNVTIIDLGLARIDDVRRDDVCWTPFDEEIFDGEGDYQYDIYRMMRKHNGDEWEKYRPLTNAMVRSVQLACPHTS